MDVRCGRAIVHLAESARWVKTLGSYARWNEAAMKAPSPEPSVDVPATTAASTTGVAPLGFDLVAGRVTAADGATCDVCLWSAATAEERSRGLMGVTDLSGALHAAGKLLYVTVHAKEDDAGYDDRNKAQDYAAIGAAADMVCVMAYDWHWSTSTPGPIAPYDWVQRVIQYTLTQIPASKVILGVGLFGYDWVGSQGQSLTWDQVTATAEKYSAPEQWDVGSQSPHLSYTDAAGQQHEVWYEDARSVQARFDLARRSELGGIELWRLGGESALRVDHGLVVVIRAA
jgi:hypothetical protein